MSNEKIVMEMPMVPSRELLDICAFTKLQKHRINKIRYNSFDSLESLTFVMDNEETSPPYGTYS